MKTIIIILALMTSIFGCSQDDQVFDISALTLRHQMFFVAAMTALNEKYPDLAQFNTSDEAASRAYYGQYDTGAFASTGNYYFTGWVGWQIIFMPGFGAAHDRLMDKVNTHELCHVLGFGHDEIDPNTGHC